MKKIKLPFALILTTIALLAPACTPLATPPPDSPDVSASPGLPKVLVVESFLADITQNVAGDRLTVEMLIPMGVDPHAFEPSPRDIARIADSTVLVINGSGFEEWLAETLANAGGQRSVIDASANLQSRVPREGEASQGAEEPAREAEPPHPTGDPHFWLDPVMVIHYVENIRDGLITVDPGGADAYTRGAANYIDQLKRLDEDIRAQVASIPPGERLIVTNHESFGYFADRYGFTIIGTIIPSVSTSASPSAQQLARLIDQIRATGAKALFLEAGTNPNLANQIAADTHLRLVTGLHTHSITPPDGPAPTYLDMMRENTRMIVEGLK